MNNLRHLRLGIVFPTKGRQASAASRAILQTEPAGAGKYKQNARMTCSVGTSVEGAPTRTNWSFFDCLGRCDSLQDQIWMSAAQGCALDGSKTVETMKVVFRCNYGQIKEATDTFL